MEVRLPRSIAGTCACATPDCRLALRLILIGVVGCHTTGSTWIRCAPPTHSLPYYCLTRSSPRSPLKVPCNLRERAKNSYEKFGTCSRALKRTTERQRFCTLQILARPENGAADTLRRGQPNIGVIFRGQGACISNEEEAGWHKNVHV